MTLSTWQWGEFLINGMQEEFQEGCVEITADLGTPSKVLKFTDIQDLIKGSFALTKTQYIAFLDWFRNTIKLGTIPFLYYDSRFNINRVVRIIGNPGITSNSNMFNISLQFAFDSNIIYKDRYLVANANYITVKSTESGAEDAIIVVYKKMRI